jgi:hypothetical protein
MYFSLHSLGHEQPNTECYFRLYAGDTIVFSPFYLDRQAALDAMKQLVMGMRGDNGKRGLKIKEKGESYRAVLFGTTPLAVGEGTIALTNGMTAEEFLEQCKTAAKAHNFKLVFFELVDETNEITSLRDLQLDKTDEIYEWRKTGSSLLHIDLKKGFGFKPSVGMQANLDKKPCEPIFNALQPFVSADLPLFHGRKEEVEEVHTLLQHRPLLLLYGAARVGKTSLLQCGLANKIKTEQAEMVVIRREDRDIISAFVAAAKSFIEKQYGADSLPETDDPLLLADHLENQTENLHYLVFDQLETMFSSDVYDAERQVFFDFIIRLLDRETYPFRVVLVLREDYLAPMADHEKELPSLLENRYRLLPLSTGSMVDATVNLLDVMKVGNKLKVDDSKSVAEKLCSQLANEKGEVPAHCLQIYLHQLQQKSCEDTPPGQPVPMNTQLIDDLGPANKLIDEFVTERIDTLSALRPKEGEPPNFALERELSELEASRVQCGCKEKSKLPAAAGGAIAAVVAPPPPATAAIAPWWMTLALLAVPLTLFGTWWWNKDDAAGSGNGEAKACLLARELDDCATYVNYLCAYGESDNCSAEFIAKLETKDCAIWQDYQALHQYATCATYQIFYERYREQGVCMDLVQSKLLEWSCPLVHDTVEVQVTVVDTFVTSGPPVYQRNPTLPNGPNGPPCEQFGGLNFKRIGPLLLTTSPLPGGPYGWEDALDACAARGFRLPCIGEIDYLIDKIYRNDADRAFSMLGGTGECFLFNPNDSPANGEISFWTATEANDATGWTYTFDLNEQTVTRQAATPKTARLPCLCAQKDPNQKGSTGLPPCYQKSIDRRSAN